MQLIFGKDVAEKLKERYTVLELETLDVEGKPLEVFCVIPAEKIAMSELTTVEHSTKLHNDFVAALKCSDYKICQDLSVHLIGRWGGEVDTFYEEILKRINSI
jgi:hypothetical protein